MEHISKSKDQLIRELAQTRERIRELEGVKTPLLQAEEALHYRLAFKRLIMNISTKFINLPSDRFDETINQALENISEFAGVDRSYLFQMSKDGLTTDNTRRFFNLP